MPSEVVVTVSNIEDRPIPLADLSKKEDNQNVRLFFLHFLIIY